MNETTNGAYRHEFARVYDRLMEDMPYEEWHRFLREAWKRYKISPRKVVDLGCGTGRQTVTLARDGLHLVGIDLSEHMLAAAQEQAERHKAAITAAGGSVAWIHQDMREWDIAEEADAVVCLCDGINYMLSERDVRAVFTRTYAGLRDGGLFVFDVLTRRQFERYASEQPFTYDDEDIAYIWYSDWAPDERLITHELTMFVLRDEKDQLFARFRETHRQRAHEEDELIRWLREAGFRSVDTFADFAWRQVTDDATRMFVCAVK